MKIPQTSLLSNRIVKLQQSRIPFLELWIEVTKDLLPNLPFELNLLWANVVSTETETFQYDAVHRQAVMSRQQPCLTETLDPEEFHFLIILEIFGRFPQDSSSKKKQR